MTYNTKQKNLILDLIKKQDKSFSINDIHAKLNNQIGLTTIYRLVDKLVLDGALTKTIGPNNTTYYQYLEKCNHDNHFYLKCDKCNSLIHIDCECINTLTNHILDEHHFKSNKEHIIINGICASCRK